MIDWGRVSGFDWDRGNATKSRDKHQVTSSEAEQVFFNEPLIVLADPKHSVAEMRFHALGCADGGRLLHVTFTLRENGTLIRVISARDMSRKERNVYAQSS
ncbi:BrnT family toxin [Pelagibacterium sp. 26DY04]|uniref:BrnT family toxin n=1 Tax=Pelagibacterium sp. 26DY04 TaxID=2967130 RepID=UPI00281671A3|nr:BrnT family toxin [Pelagibacterium sp. 26DY04]WMT85960.1 BrnT family toxin [Pelagibacterium sp. 26DY04]